MFGRSKPWTKHLGIAQAKALDDLFTHLRRRGSCHRKHDRVP